jgi:hypothetical protein
VHRYRKPLRKLKVTRVFKEKVISTKESSFYFCGYIYHIWCGEVYATYGQYGYDDEVELEVDESDRMSLEDFIEVNEDELKCIFAESGADRELDFDYYAQVEKILDGHIEYPNLTYRWVKLDKGLPDEVT